MRYPEGHKCEECGWDVQFPAHPCFCGPWKSVYRLEVALRVSEAEVERLTVDRGSETAETCATPGCTGKEQMCADNLNDVDPSPTWNPDEWDRCCTRCHAILEWPWDLPDVEDDAICHGCAWAELEDFRKVGLMIYENMKGTCACDDPPDQPCQRPSFAGFLHGLCHEHAEEFDAPIEAAVEQTMLDGLRRALRVP